MKRPHDYESITELNISNKKLTELPSWLSECEKLEKLGCSGNQITQLDNLLPRLEILNCCNNQITQLDNLSYNLQMLICYNNNITHLNNLPKTLEHLECFHNEIIELDYLPPNLEYLICDDNPLKYDFEPTLENIRKYNNQNTKINYKNKKLISKVF